MLRPVGYHQKANVYI